MTFSESIRTCLREKYVTFSGRASRSEYWWFYLFNVIINIAVYVFGFLIAGAAIFAAGDPSQLGTGSVAGLAIFGIVLLIVTLGLILPNLAVTVRRLHDRNLSGWWLLGFFIALIVSALISQILYSLIAIVGGIGMLVMLVMLILKGTDGPNNFGPDPLRTSDADVFN